MATVLVVDDSAGGWGRAQRAPGLQELNWQKIQRIQALLGELQESHHGYRPRCR